MAVERTKACFVCKKLFASNAARSMHIKAAHGKVLAQQADAERKRAHKELMSLPKSVRIDVAREVFGDLSDGAFFAAASETGL